MLPGSVSLLLALNSAQVTTLSLHAFHVEHVYREP